MTPAVHAAHEGVISNGAYAKILDKWGVAVGGDHRRRPSTAPPAESDDRRRPVPRATAPATAPEDIRAVPVRHPGRWVAGAIVRC